MPSRAGAPKSIPICSFSKPERSSGSHFREDAVPRLRRLVLTATVLLAWPLGRDAPRAADCLPGDRPLDGSCNAPLDRGKAGSTFIRIDGFKPSDPLAPPARTVSNLFLKQDPIPGLDLFETTLIPFADLKEGPHPQKHRAYHLNALAVAFGQAVIHDMTKAPTGFSPAALAAPDFQYAADDPLCQKQHAEPAPRLHPGRVAANS
jgi:hypothetical protein